jgi:hypothetical protein
MGRMRLSGASNTLLLGLVVLACSGCGSDDGEAGSPGPAATSGTAFEFTGYIFSSGGETRICDAIRESYPPQCGGESYRVTGLDFSGVELEDAQGVSWTQQPVTLEGVLAADGETLMVSPNPALGRGVPPPTVGGQPGSAPG